jgi:ribA/ribD-fused uncharacterized protein
MNPDNVVYFWRQTEQPYGVFSNWANSPFTDLEGHVFLTCEHYLMYYKALLMNDDVIADAIIHCKSPKRVKALGRRVRNWDEQKWVANREEIMFQGIFLKCIENENIKTLLLQTKDKIIAEASPYDSIWGIGITEKDAKSGVPFKGLNLLGKALMQVRSKLQHHRV